MLHFKAVPAAPVVNRDAVGRAFFVWRSVVNGSMCGGSITHNRVAYLWQSTCMVLTVRPIGRFLWNP